MVFYLLNVEKSKIFEQMRVGIKTARLWATYACTSLGGASECPTLEDLKKFENNIDSYHLIKDLDIFIIDLIDKAYAKC